ncbi:ABC transporter substrate-binding protein [Ancylobacter sp.]|uniref:ABC transporter substrate-binding protein n=1 Tax=Ancylobacter sp. TaxID=1872567 RepID=UPI003C7ADAB6
MKRFNLAAVTLAGMAIVAGVQSASARDLTVVGFGGTLQDAFRKAYFEPYAAATGSKLVEDTTNGGIAKQKAMVETKNVTWDVVQMEEDEVTLACAEGLLLNVDWAKLPSYSKADPTMFSECGAGAIVWSEVLTYDAAKIKDGPKNWADFWNVAKWPGKRGLRKTAKLTLELALMADGVPGSDVYRVLATKEGQDRAFKKLDELKPNVQWWESGAQPLEWLASGAVAMTAAYNGRIANARKEGRDFPIIWGDSLYSIDYWAIIAGSSNEKQALEFVDFALSTSPQKAFAEAIPYGIANKEAMAALPADLLSQLPSAPDNLKGAVKINSEFWTDHGQELNERFSAWVAR